MQLSNEWFIATYDTDMGDIAVRGRLHLDTMRLSGAYSMRIEMQWDIKGDDKGMPTETEGEVIDSIMHIITEALERSNTAILTAIHTGARMVRYVFYATSADNFSHTIQPLLQRLGNLPIRIGAETDRQWDEYTSMIARMAIG